MANDALVKDLKVALSIDPEVLLQTARKVNTDTGFRLRDEDVVEIVRVWGESGVPTNQVNDALSVLRHIFKRAVEEDVSPDTVLDEIRELCAARGLEGFEDRVTALKEILTPTPRYLERNKFLPFVQGVERNLETISGVVDLRAVFRDTKSDDIVGYVPMVIVRLGCGHDEEDDKHAVRFTFQLSEKSLNRLVEALEEYRTQLHAVKNSLPPDFQCFEDDENSENNGA